MASCCASMSGVKSVSNQSIVEMPRHVMAGVVGVLGLGLVHLLGVAAFALGFLVARVEVLDQSSPCGVRVQEVPPPQRPLGKNPCDILPRPPSKVILVVIDALRIDFAVARMPFFTRAQPSGSSGLFVFRADPPTTTSQRLKALTTGGIPAFIEAG
eukprot:RCo024288